MIDPMIKSLVCSAVSSACLIIGMRMCSITPSSPIWWGLYLTWLGAFLAC
jgi:hypothetical protein